jgi:excisionase family DNA binding protein
MEDRHLSLSEVAGLLGVSERSVRRWIKAGELRAYKPGRDFRIPESGLRAFMEEREVRPKVEAPPEQERREPEVHIDASHMHGQGSLRAAGYRKIDPDTLGAILWRVHRQEITPDEAMEEVAAASEPA